MIFKRSKGIPKTKTKQKKNWRQFHQISYPIGLPQRETENKKVKKPSNKKCKKIAHNEKTCISRLKGTLSTQKNRKNEPDLASSNYQGWSWESIGFQKVKLILYKAQESKVNQSSQ